MDPEDREDQIWKTVLQLGWESWRKGTVWGQNLLGEMQWVPERKGKPRSSLSILRASAVLLTDKSKEKLCCQVQQGRWRSMHQETQREGERREMGSSLWLEAERHTPPPCVFVRVF